jgi:HD-like signal output (HDOD) protein
MTDKSILFFNKLKKAVETDQLTLPTLPEVAIKIREAVESESNSAQQIAGILAQDASLTARLLQVANSPIYRARSQIDDLTMAIARLGTRVVRDLVVCLAMKQIFQSTSDLLDQQFRELWSTSVEVAAISRMIAGESSLNPEQALIAGLIHNIGALPILKMSEGDEELSTDKDALNQLIKDLQGPVGKLILSFWNFPDHLIDVVSKWNVFNRQHNGPADYVDIVQISILQSGRTQYSDAPEDWASVPAFSTVGIEPDISIIEVEENKIKINETRQSLSVM